MSDETSNPLADMKMDVENLHREEIYTDLRIGTIRKLVPVKTDGTDDETRTPKFTGEASILTQAGPVPVNSPIEANTLEEAVAAFPAAIQQGVERLMEEVREMQRKESSRIVVPGQTPGIPGNLTGRPGGGKIDLT